MDVLDMTYSLQIGDTSLNSKYDWCQCSKSTSTTFILVGVVVVALAVFAFYWFCWRKRKVEGRLN